eukprot:356123-Chlamydomonas_euryale.AAC.2
MQVGHLATGRFVHRRGATLAGRRAQRRSHRTLFVRWLPHLCGHTENGGSVGTAGAMPWCVASATQPCSRVKRRQSAQMDAFYGRLSRRMQAQTGQIGLVPEHILYLTYRI